MEHFLIPVQAARACWPAALATRMAVQHVRNTALLASAASRQPVQRGSMAAAARLVGLEHRVVHHAGGRARGQQVLERVAAVVRLARPQVDRPGPIAPQRQVADRQRGRRVVAAGAAAAHRGAEQVVRLPGGVVRGRGRRVPGPPARRAPVKEP